MALTRPRYSQIYDTDYKQSCRVATTTNVNLTGGAPTTVDSISLSAGNRVLVRTQNTASQNGIYVVLTLGTGSNGTWIRSLDADSAIKLTSGAQVGIEEGTTLGGKLYRLTTPGPIVLGTTPLTWTDSSGGGGSSAGGLDGQVQFNSINTFGGATYVYYNSTTGQVTANAGISSTSTTTGTFVVTGGVGISQNLNVGGLVNSAGNLLVYVSNSSAASYTTSNVTGFQITQAISTSLGSLAIGFGSNTSPGSFMTIAASGGRNYISAGAARDFYIQTSTGSQALYITNANSNVTINSTTTSTSTDTGALVVKGGVGVAGDISIGGNLTVNGTTTNINTTNLVIEDKNIVLADVTSPSDVTADGAGITVKGATDKTFNWVNATTAWTSSEDFNLLTGKQYEINGTSVLTATTLGSGVVNSSLTSLGTVTSLVATTAVATNFSSGNIRISGGYASGLANIAVSGASTLTGNLSVGVSASTTRANLYVHGGTLQNGVGNVLPIAEFVVTNSNASYLRITQNRVATGSDWTTASTKIQHRIDATDMGYLEFNPVGANQGIGLGSGATEHIRITQGGNVVVTSTTASTTTTTGALVVRGGAGIAGAVNTGGNVTVTGFVMPSANLTYDLGSGTTWWRTFFGVSTQARYADLAENYQADQSYDPGTVLIFGGTDEVTTTDQDHDTRVAGVVSTNPAHLMNGGLTGPNVVELGLTGRLPCRVLGPVATGDVLVTSGIPGVAQRIDNTKFLPGCVIGKALKSVNTNTIETIEIVVGRF